jgi:hypothetical protein
MIFRVLLVLVTQLTIYGIHIAAEPENIPQRRVREEKRAANGHDVFMAVQEEIDVFRFRNLGSLSAPTKPVVPPTVKLPTPVSAPVVRRRMTSTTTTDYDVFDAIEEEANMFRNLGSLSVPVAKPVISPVGAPQKPSPLVISPVVAPPKPVYSPV